MSSRLARQGPLPLAWQPREARVLTPDLGVGQRHAIFSVKPKRGRGCDRSITWPRLRPRFTPRLGSLCSSRSWFSSALRSRSAEVNGRVTETENLAAPDPPDYRNSDACGDCPQSTRCSGHSVLAAPCVCDASVPPAAHEAGPLAPVTRVREPDSERPEHDRFLAGSAEPELTLVLNVVPPCTPIQVQSP